MRSLRICSLIILIMFVAACQPTLQPGNEPLDAQGMTMVGSWEDIGNVSILDIQLRPYSFGSNSECARFLAQEIKLWEKSHTGRRVIDVDYAWFSDDAITCNCATTIMIYSTAVQTE